jgi:hypothetical protein
MMKRHRCRAARRRGLAPFEMVLAIPILLFVVGLTVVFGVVACWKVRGQMASRDAVWSTRWPRWGTGVPTPLEWPAPATRTWRAAGSVAALNHQAFQHPVIRGPLPNNLQVNTQLFDPTLELHVGESQTTRTPPALARLGQYSLDIEQPILDGKWQFGQTGLASNTSRRIPNLYPDIPDPPQVRGLEMRYQQSVQTLVSAPCQPALAVLDRDQEIYAWYYTYHDFHPRFPRFCELDTDAVRQAHMPGHLLRVDCHTPLGQQMPPHGVPADLANFFKRLYEQQLAVLQNSLPPGPPQQIAELQRRIRILEAFLAYLDTL